MRLNKVLIQFGNNQYNIKHTQMSVTSKKQKT